MIALTNSVRLNLVALGLKAQEQEIPELGQFLALQRAPREGVE
jgi:hypothetical protein